MSASLTAQLSRSRQRAAALTLSAALLLVPAYALPVMTMQNFGHHHADTIFSGVWKLWHQGLWGLALIVFVASMVVPVLKLTGLGFLLLTIERPHWASAETRRRLHAVLHTVGRWSMLDIFLVSFLCGIVRFEGLASVGAGAGAVAFAAVVVLTLLATQAYEPLANPPPAFSSTPARHD